MKPVLTLFAALTLGSSVALADCVQPVTPTLPDGATSTMDDMIAGQQAVRAYQAENLEYMGCLEKKFTAAKKEIEGGKARNTKELQASYEEAVNAYNEAVSAEEAIAGQFNTEIREYRAVNPN